MNTEYAFSKEDSCSSLVVELPFFFSGMTNDEFEAEEKRFAQFLFDGGKPYEYIPLNKRKASESTP